MLDRHFICLILIFVKIASFEGPDLLSSAAMGANLQEELQPFGVTPKHLLQFSRAEARLFRYLDLTPESIARKRQTGIPLPQGVVVHEDRPLLYVIRNDLLAQTPKGSRDDIARVVRTLACRGEGEYLAVVYPGELVVYPLNLSTGNPKGFAISGRDQRAPMLVSDLASGFDFDHGSQKKQARANADALHQLLFKLLTKVSTALRESGVLQASRDNDQVLPLVGRALFARFLIDRGIINPVTFQEIHQSSKPEDCFASPKLAALTCSWLDDKFNGELLPMFENPHPEYKDYLEFFEQIYTHSDRVLHELSNILYRAPDGSLMLDLDWCGIDFAHVPVGLLSEVYEDYAHRFYKDDALRESVRFTPKHIAEFTVDQAFAGIDKAKRHCAKILDPAAGAGIFLVLSFQRLFAERWEAAGQRPDTIEIRKILQKQIRGFDINGSALTLAALSLYLTALELDAEPYPPEKLRFERLLGSVLFNMRQENEQFPYKGHVLGSLGPLGGGKEHIGAYDLVIGNPPWTAWKGNEGRKINNHVTSMAKRILAEREGDANLDNLADEYEHNDNLPDVAFLWRAMEWAKKDGVGVIGLIVHGRLLFKRAAKGANMRGALFQSMHVTGILNGSELTAMWPSLNQPFCIIFARNEMPKPSSRFRFVTPALDMGTGGQYRMRFDHEASQPIDLSAVKQRPFLLKSLFRGGAFDVELIGRLVEMTLPTEVEIDEIESSGEDTAPARWIPPLAVTIGDIWRDVGGLPSGQGFMPGKGQKTTELLALRGKRLTTDDAPGLRVECVPLKLKKFTETELHRRRDPKIYCPPLVFVSEGFGETKNAIRSRIYIEDTPLIYSRNFYGFSTAGHPDSILLAKYLFVLTSSDLFSYFMLQTSAKYGVERRTILVEDIKAFPMIPVERLSSAQRRSVLKIADSLSLADSRSWAHLNRWVTDLYELTNADSQVIEDTLATRMPYESSRNHALAETTKHEVEEFRKSIESVLSPLFTSVGDSISVKPVELPTRTWLSFDIVSGNSAAIAHPFGSMLPLATALGDQEGASRIFLETGENRLRIAIRNQYRYFTKTRGRQCALDILRSYGHVFPVSAT